MAAVAVARSRPDCSPTFSAPIPSPRPFAALLVGRDTGGRRGGLPVERRTRRHRHDRLLHADRRRPVRLRENRRRERLVGRLRDGRHAYCSHWPSWACRSKCCRCAVIREILRGGESICAEARHPGGRRSQHRLSRADLRPGGDRASGPGRRARATPTAAPGDALVLGKPLGVGILSAAFKRDRLDAAGYRSTDRDDDAAQRAGPPRAHRRACTP